MTKRLNITKKGSDILSSGVEITNSLLADISEDFRQFVKVSPDKDEASAVESKDGQDGRLIWRKLRKRRWSRLTS